MRHCTTNIPPVLSFVPFALALALLGAACSGSDAPDPSISTSNTSSGSGSIELLPAYEPPAGEEGTSAIPRDDSRIVAWASGYESVDFGSDVEPPFDDPDNALGAAEGDTELVLSIGNGGSIVLTFDRPIADGEGADFAVFENGFDDFFLELAYVEVSSDGTRFVRFGSAYLGDEPVAQYGTHDSELIGGLAGKYRAGFGTPFDLALLADTGAVRTEEINLGAITHVRVVDIIGDGSQLDSFDNPIYDPTPTVGSGGFDLDGIGVINVAAQRRQQ